MEEGECALFFSSWSIKYHFSPMSFIFIFFLGQRIGEVTDPSSFTFISAVLLKYKRTRMKTLMSPEGSLLAENMIPL